MKKEASVLALWGKPNNGKSETILKFVDLLIAHGAEIESAENSWFNTTDKWFVLKYKSILIGVTSRGDTRALLEEDFKNFMDCDICICATHTRGATVKFIEETYCSNNIYWLRKSTLCVGTNNKDHFINEYLNRRQAEDMLYFLENMLLNRRVI